MSARLVRVLLGGATLAASGTYTFVYLYRWEWNQAMISATIFIAAEVAVISSLLAHRIRVVSNRLDALADGHPGAPRRVPTPRVAATVGTATVGRQARIHDSTPPPHAGFAWLARPERMNVFVPVLVGAGVALSGLA